MCLQRLNTSPTWWCCSILKSWPQKLALSALLCFLTLELWVSGIFSFFEVTVWLHHGVTYIPETTLETDTRLKSAHTFCTHSSRHCASTTGFCVHMQRDWLRELLNTLLTWETFFRKILNKGGKYIWNVLRWMSLLLRWSPSFLNKPARNSTTSRWTFITFIISISSESLSEWLSRQGALWMAPT